LRHHQDVLHHELLQVEFAFLFPGSDLFE